MLIYPYGLVPTRGIRVANFVQLRLTYQSSLYICFAELTHHYTIVSSFSLSLHHPLLVTLNPTLPTGTRRIRHKLGYGVDSISIPFRFLYFLHRTIRLHVLRHSFTFRLSIHLTLASSWLFFEFTMPACKVKRRFANFFQFTPPDKCIFINYLWTL